MNLNNNNYCQIPAPPSKSYFIRRIAAACLFGGARLSYSGELPEDALAALNIARSLGHEIEVSDTFIAIGSAPPRQNNGILPLNAGESALVLNLFAVIASFYADKYTITLNGTLAGRKFDGGDVLKRFGIRYERFADRIEFEGQFKAGDFSFDTAESNQMISAILFGAAASGGKYEYDHPKLSSVGYLQMTCEVLRSYGLEVHCDGKKTILEGISGLCQCSIEATIEGDWSSAANFLVAGAIYKPVEISGLNLKSPQPDIKIVEILQSAGASVFVTGSKVRVHPFKELKSFNVDLSGAPDLFPPAAALALHCEGTTELAGVRRLRNKESDRAIALVEEFTKMGGKLEISGDELIIHGKAILSGAQIDPRGDHRIAMAAMIASLASRHTCEIGDLKCINKSYPAFLHDFSTLLSYD